MAKNGKRRLADEPRKITATELIGLIMAIGIPVLALVLGAPAAAGVVDMSQARYWLAAAWLLTVVGACVIEYLSTRSRRRIVITTLISAIVMGVFLLYFYHRIEQLKAEQESRRSLPASTETGSQPEMKIEPYPPFLPAYERYKHLLGQRLSHEESAGMVHQAAHEHAMVIWTMADTRFYVLPFDADMPWFSEHDPSWDVRTNWFNKEERIKKFGHPPEGLNPPYAGVASHWDKASGKWKWIGWMYFFCIFEPNTIFFQQFENGILIGPFRYHEQVVDSAEVIVILNDHSWRGVDVQGPIPPCLRPHDE